MQRFLIIQTAFIGDVVLATALVEKLHHCFPKSPIDFLLRQGNESLLANHPFINEVIIWNKKTDKQKNLIKTIAIVRSRRYTHVVNVHRFATSGLISAFSGAQSKIGFAKNPFSFAFSKRLPHPISMPYHKAPVHETTRNQALIEDLTDAEPARPRLYPSPTDFIRVKQWQARPYVCIAPTSVWYTKQFPATRWVELIQALPDSYAVFLLGGAADASISSQIVEATLGKVVDNLCGQLSFLESAALMAGAAMNYANDSAPLHFASAMNAPVTAVYCSTVPAFGFYPLSDRHRVVEVSDRLYCKPCGLHGRSACPEGHFKCAMDIELNQLLWWI